jgi:glucokinase
MSMRTAPVVLGIDFGGTKIAAAVCDLAGTTLASVVVESRGEQGARIAFDHGIHTAKALLTETSPDARLAAVGVATFGIPFEDRVALAPAITDWAALEFGRELRTAFPDAAVRMATDAKAAAHAEARWGALAGADPAVYLNLGTGLAAAIVVGGEVVSGRDGAAGEIGYNLRELADVGVPERHRLMLEEMVSGMGLQRRASSPGRPLTAADVFAELPGFDDLIAEFVDELAFHIVNLSILINPARIAVGGGMTRSWERIQPRLAEALLAGVPYPPELVLAEFQHDAPLRGAVALAVDAATRGPGRRQETAFDRHPDGQSGSVTNAVNASSTSTIGNLA